MNDEDNSALECSATINDRFTFQFEEKKLLFRRIGPHDIMKKEN
jgi:hypothetical protein